MRIRLAVFLALFFGVLASPTHALVTDLSNRHIEIRYSFSGADLILFGAVGATPIGAPHDPYDVVIVVRGPELPTLVRRKERVGGVWINRHVARFPSAPGYYAVATNRPLNEIAAPTVFATYGIGYENLPLVAESPRGLVAPDPNFRKALYRLRSEEGLYRQGLDTVNLISEGLFRTDVHLPANVPIGEFQVDTFLFQQGSLKARNRINLTVGKEGFERTAYTFAHSYPFFYGITAVFVALCAGWLAGVIGRK
ncbi:TIGR02186 family protein [Kordiimonas marina]|uniref:TIGR02186 family protein n=1 Tax=Kordiimonas marina TaxID=2872312 RepID=UPI001FF6DD3F|nr:TIGR02186 family protein [Kordiimonas marina]MCJ9428334.1 TIGR02186 family protein [Kordiimonas marina]